MDKEKREKEIKKYLPEWVLEVEELERLVEKRMKKKSNDKEVAS